MSEPWLTIGVLQWSRLDWLDACLRHLASQTRKDFEVIIGDDGFREANPAGGASVRETLEVIGRHDLPSLTYRRRADDETPSIMHNAHRIIKRAKGQYLWILGADDLLYPHAVERIGEIARGGAYPSTIYCNHDIWLPTIAPASFDELAPTDRRMANTECRDETLGGMVEEIGDAITAMYALVMPRTYWTQAFFGQDHLPFTFADPVRGAPHAAWLIEELGPSAPVYRMGEPLMISSHRVTWAEEPTALEWDKGWYLRRVREIAAQ